MTNVFAGWITGHDPHHGLGVTRDGGTILRDPKQGDVLRRRLDTQSLAHNLYPSRFIVVQAAE
jgi:hypothetical protein